MKIQIIKKLRLNQTGVNSDFYNYNSATVFHPYKLNCLQFKTQPTNRKKGATTHINLSPRIVEKHLVTISEVLYVSR